MKDKKWLIREMNNIYGGYTPTGWDDAVLACFDLAKQLDEPQKATVPKWFDEWMKKKVGLITDRLDLAYRIVDDLNAHRLTSEQKDYITDHSRDILSALLYGYEVEEEEEKLYWVDLGKSNYTYNYINKNGFVRGTYYFDVVRKFGLMTEAEIKAIDKRYWAFSVPVEEVKNG